MTAGAETDVINSPELRHNFALIRYYTVTHAIIRTIANNIEEKPVS